MDMLEENFKELEKECKCPNCGATAKVNGRYYTAFNDVATIECPDCGREYQISLEKKGVIRDIINTKDGKKMAEAMANFVNSYGIPEKEFIEQMSREHRTLQQSFTGLCLKWLKSLSEQEYFDDRNKASVEIAKKIMNALGNDIYLPMI